ncbi:MAG: transcriptional regulator NrdR [Nitrospirae bacterium CG_4_9_14_3_um_filter_53_35]|nr:MAG: transcriptional regulator NrdR [Nitrospirae bacterium CG2_30_53_67]PIS36422.1 MAG: transcriptional regulator NrdR [Nitrospirae bacterium CG08_land_8_20_14_0_20_52_24]PIV85548.1 MAG: transcriptional regulator NrdR [Nitrospirae bacterium CG17_big_fil_post_rev_8_21_14_2_50_50_9]PIW84183.1 MAG: transcriptional regulator NrdR [Nitrospirae bacterium CG_4_8_14_3_um_filter_50_41]PIX84500.1 MAG: transcriptional regulator NrdR [Nitrospirae bacterium CG_4_10_14_3_um_filter_53_41]PJA74638.1 MAG: t
MKCPFCGHVEDKVVDSRLRREGDAIRRRRECLSCRRRFTTHERVEDILPMVIKKDNRREPFDRKKIMDGMVRACEKRSVSMDTIEAIVDRIERKFQDRMEKEIRSEEIGEEVMRALHETDDVAYVRFASVYRSFKDLNDFMNELEEILKLREQGKTKTVDNKEAVP